MINEYNMRFSLIDQMEDVTFFFFSALFFFLQNDGQLEINKRVRRRRWRRRPGRQQQPADSWPLYNVDGFEPVGAIDVIRLRRNPGTYFS